MLFAAMYPKRTGALVLYGSYARRAWAPDYPFGHTEANFKTSRHPSDIAHFSSAIRDWLARN
jgi:hypothetical protein